MRFLIFCLLLGVSYAKISTYVDVEYDSILAASGSSVTIPCDYVMLPEDDQPPIIFWIKGASPDDKSSEVIFKGFRYWNESHGEYREFFGDYAERASVANLSSPGISISGLSSSDEGRYWCMVAEWSGRQQSGTGADSSAVMIDSAKDYVDAQTNFNVTVDSGNNATLQCSGKGVYDMVNWYIGPYHNSDQNNFTHTEIGSYKKIGSYDVTTSSVTMEPEFPKMNIDMSRTLSVSNPQYTEAGKYWCELTNRKASNVELETSRSPIELIVITQIGGSCSTDGEKYNSPNDCAKYLECNQGKWIERECGYDGLVFDEVDGVCDWAANVPPPCGTGSSD